MKQESIVVGANTKYPLKGLLTLPDAGHKPVPAVVFVHGSGSSNMDEKVGKLTPFKDLAEGLAKHGIASVRYDKRSFAHGFKMVREKKPITVKEETIEDAVLAAELLRKDARIDSENIFIVGHSMGAMLAPRIDAEGGSFKGLILMAGSPRTLEQIMLGQNADMLAASKGLMRWIMKKQVAKFEKLFDGMYELTDEEAKKVKMGGGTTLYYFKEMGEQPASDYLTKSEKPMLIMQGSEDFQAKADTDFTGYQTLLQGRANVTFKMHEGLNHCFVPSVCGDITKVKKEYNVERHIGEDVIADIANWIWEQCL
ncbi:MAG: alpha/beta fold hydrolase [Oscillospiraceae bacterium]|nr:alpha/beta fold hydrolase [Oscillospiraceae bacterium]